MIRNPSRAVDHIISVVGWGSDEADRTGTFEFHGCEMGYVRVGVGFLWVEDGGNWAVPDEFLAPEG